MDLMHIKFSQDWYQKVRFLHLVYGHILDSESVKPQEA